MLQFSNLTQVTATITVKTLYIAGAPAQCMKGVRFPASCTIYHCAANSFAILQGWEVFFFLGKAYGCCLIQVCTCYLDPYHMNVYQ